MTTNSSQSPPIDGSKSNFSTRDTEMSSPQSSTVANGTPAVGSRYSVPLVGGGDRRNSTGESSPAAAAGGRRHVRSREGCLTCKRRKVKCDEQRPRCSHCERLNMECKWRPHQPRGLPSQRTHIQKQQQQPGFDVAVPRSGQTMVSGAGGAGPGAVPTGVSPATETPSGAGYQSQQHAVDEVFDYASFMWGSGGELWQQVSPGTDQNVGLDTHIMSHNQGTDAQINFPQRVPFTPSSTLPGVNGYGLQPTKHILTAESEKLLDFFISSPIPPILAEVEAHKKWLAMRQVVTDMARVSRMVSCAILAFSDFLFRRRDETWRATENYYEDAVAEVVTYDGTTLVEHTLGREWLLAALFFLSYVDILENRMDAAHSHLKRAYTILQHGNKLGFVPVERQLLLWIRIVDGRAVSAGGEGLFLSKDDELLLVETSPASLDAEIDERVKQDGSDEDIKDVLFQVLYQPGIIFYQKVQSFMGRISMIDPWHRSRGTVEDETEVMNTAAVIATDLRTLYDQRPPLMDYAVAGKLSEPHISSHLAFAITRAFRTYLSNYYASKVHLHRVAYKTLPLTREAADALDHIRRLAKQIVADSEASPGSSGSGGGGGSGRGSDSDLADGDALPVTMLWPLLMLGVEEQDVAEKAWIKTQILRMEKVASNARITARVLEEVQARQDAAKARMDIRSIMHVVFNQCFAIT